MMTTRSPHVWRISYAREGYERPTVRWFFRGEDADDLYRRLVGRLPGFEHLQPLRWARLERADIGELETMQEVHR
jgi:hypothetical protein